MAGYGRKVGVALLSAGFFGPAGGSPHTQRVPFLLSSRN